MKEYYTTKEAGEVLGLDRTQVFRLIQSGKIPAVRFGKNYFIKAVDLGIADGEVTKKQEKQIDKAVEKVFEEYGETIKKLGKE